MSGGWMQARLAGGHPLDETARPLANFQFCSLEVSRTERPTWPDEASQRPPPQVELPATRRNPRAIWTTTPTAAVLRCKRSSRRLRQRGQACSATSAGAPRAHGRTGTNRALCPPRTIDRPVQIDARRRPRRVIDDSTGKTTLFRPN